MGRPSFCVFSLSGFSSPSPDAPPGSLCPPHGVVRLPHGTPVLLRFFLSGLSPPPPDAPPGSLCPPHGVVRLPHGTPVLLRFFLSGLSPPPPDAPPAPRRPSRCGSGPKKGDAAFQRHPRTCRPCKPGSVPGANPGPLSFIWDGSLLPPRATYPPASGEQPLTAGIHGLATHGTYGRATSLPPRWALTPPFHPYPQSPAGGRSLLRSHNLTAVRPLACVALCVARTFLSRPAAGSDRADLPRQR